MDRRKIAGRRSVANAAVARLRQERGGAEPAPPPAHPETYDATDAAAELMAKKRINPFVVPATGEGGRIVKNDVDRYIQQRGNS